MRPNAGAPQGFPWAKKQKVYHATMALDRVMDEGLKPRKMIGDIHATGGGPDESISFTLDRRVAVAIAIGLRTFARAARREISLGQMVSNLRPLAPLGTAEQLRSMQLTDRAIDLIGRGLIPFSAGIGAWQHTISIDAYLDADKSELHEVEERSAGGKWPIYVFGWAPPDVVRRMQEASVRPERLYRVDPGLDTWGVNRAFEFYKYMLSYADFQHELYNPLFMHTSPETMKDVDLSQIAVVSATVDADWVCGEHSSISQLGYDMEGMWPVTMSDWANSCEQTLRHGRTWRTSPPRKDWEAPTPEATVYYTASMAELRVYDRTLVRDLRIDAEDDDVVSDVEIEWSNRGKEVSDPLAHPYFKTRHPLIAP